ncbi:MAG: hypothetical protein Q8P71_00825 [bacterium]|nr:hypothetical protein [bacterium]
MLSMNSSIPILLIQNLKEAADAFPITDSSAPAHERHKAILESNVKICLTRNKTWEDGEAYYLSIQGEDTPSDAIVQHILSSFLGKEFMAKELWGIATPSIRVFSWPVVG